MPPKQNPLKLNPLQLRTLVVLQALARVRGASKAGLQPDEVTITHFPQQHGDHFHVGETVVLASDATGLHNEAVWNALTRKGLARVDWPHTITLTAGGIAYETGLAEKIFRPVPR